MQGFNSWVPCFWSPKYEWSCFVTALLSHLCCSVVFSVTFKNCFRSYGRAPKMIHLESNFVQFKEELLPKEGNKALLTFPFLHIYWTECCVSTGWGRKPVWEEEWPHDLVCGTVFSWCYIALVPQTGGVVPASANCGFPGESLSIVWFWLWALVAVGLISLGLFTFCCHVLSSPPGLLHLVGPLLYSAWRCSFHVCFVIAYSQAQIGFSCPWTKRKFWGLFLPF